MTKVSGFKFRSGFAMEPHPRHKKMIEEKSSSSSFSPFSTILSKSISAVISPLKPQEEVVKAPSDGKKEEENKEEDKYKLRKESNVIMNGEDSLLGGETFLCICDGVGGWKFTTSKDDPDQKKFDPSSALYTALLTQQIEIILQGSKPFIIFDFILLLLLCETNLKVFDLLLNFLPFLFFLISFFKKNNPIIK